MACHIDLCVSVHELVGVAMNTVSRIGNQLVAFCKFQISRHHFRDKLAKAYLWLPTQLGSRLARVTHERFNLCWPKIMPIDIILGQQRLKRSRVTRARREPSWVG